MKNLLEYIKESYAATYFKTWKSITKMSTGIKLPWSKDFKLYNNDEFLTNDIVGVYHVDAWRSKKYGTLYFGFLDKSETKKPEIKLYSDKGIFNNLKDIQDAYNTKETNLKKLVSAYKIKMSLIFYNFNCYTCYKKWENWRMTEFKEEIMPQSLKNYKNLIGKCLGECSFETFSIVDIDLSNPDNNDAKYIYKNYSHKSIKKGRVATGKNPNGGRVSIGYCAYTFNPYHTYEEVETDDLGSIDRNLIPALLNEYFKAIQTDFLWDNKKISLSLFKNQLELQKGKYNEFREFIKNDIRTLNDDVMKRHEKYLQSDDYKNAEAARRHDDYLLMTNGL